MLGPPLPDMSWSGIDEKPSEPKPRGLGTQSRRREGLASGQPVSRCDRGLRRCRRGDPVYEEPRRLLSAQFLNERTDNEFQFVTGLVVVNASLATAETSEIPISRATGPGNSSILRQVSGLKFRRRL